MHLGEMIKKYRKENNLNMREFAEISGISRAYVSVLERNKNPNSGDPVIPSITTIQKLSNAMNIDFDDLVKSLDDEQVISFENDDDQYALIKCMTNVYNQLSPTNQQKTYDYASDLLDIQNNQNKVIHLDDYIEETQNEGVQLALHGRLSAGTGTINYDRTNPEMIIYYGKVPKHDLCFIVKGDSMTPLFKDSEIIFIERTYDIRSGQVIAVSINGEEYVKKAYKEDHQLRLVSLNKKYEDITANEFDDIRVIGRVIL